MKPVNVNAFDIIGNLAAGARVPFGCAVRRNGAGKVDIAYDGNAYHAIVGIADWDPVEKIVDGFYSQYDTVPIVTAGRARVWVLGHQTSIVEGGFLKSADLGSPACGVFDKEATITTRTINSLAKVLEDPTDLLHADYGDKPASSAIGSDITMASAAVVTNMALSEGDYIAIGNTNDDEAEVNRVKSIAAAVITTQEPLVQTYTCGASNTKVHKLVQLGVLLI